MMPETVKILAINPGSTSTKIAVFEGEDKVCSLKEAIAKHVKKGMSISFAGRGGALFNQLVREFWDKDPGFIIINNGITATVLALIHGRLARKIIASRAVATGRPRLSTRDASRRDRGRSILAVPQPPYRINSGIDGMT